MTAGTTPLVSITIKMSPPQPPIPSSARSPNEQAALDGYLRGEIFKMLEDDFDAWGGGFWPNLSKETLDVWRHTRCAIWATSPFKLVAVDPALYA